MKILAIDSNSVINRAYYAIRPLTTKDGRFTHAIVGFLNTFWKLDEEIQPDRVVFAFDLKGPTFRHKLFENYKAHRKPMPQELAEQLDPLKKILTAMGYPILTAEGYEADDVLGTIAARCLDGGDECVIATGDRDSFQLIRKGVSVCLAYTKGGRSDTEIIDEQEIRQRYNLEPFQLLEVKALMGDASDNIPGVAGVGEKTALRLIADFKTVEGVYENIDSPLITDSLRRKLESGRDLAQISRSLAEIDCDVPLGEGSCLMPKLPPDQEKLYEILNDLEMRFAIARLKLLPPEKLEEAVKKNEASRILCTAGDTERFKRLLSAPQLFAAVDWSDTDPLIAVTDGEHAAAACGETAKGWLEMLVGASGHLTLADSKQWYAYLYNRGINIRLVDFDPALAGYLLSPLSASYDISSMCTGKSPAAAISIFEGQMPPELKKTAEDALLLVGLCPCLKDELREKGMEKLLYETEQPLSNVLAFMENAGFALDRQGLIEYGTELDRDLESLTERIYFLAGRDFNINSPKQLSDILFAELSLPAKKKTKSGWSTDAEVLESLRPLHPIIDEILSYRRLAKLKSTYVEGLLSKIAGDGRVHTVFRQTETRTGRISSTEPNLQNIPVRTERGSLLRRFFCAPDGYCLVDADYSQIELRVLAHIAQDEAMQKAFLDGKDIHTQTAAQVFDMPEEFVTPPMRSAAKAVNFGIVYGIGAFSLAQDIGVTVAEADRYIKSYLETYSGVKDYMEKTIAAAKRDGFVTTMFGRRRPLPELSAQNKNTRAFGERAAMNTPIQGTAADIIKTAMVRVFNRLKEENLRSRLILQVHDELLVEAPEQEAERAAQILTQEMQRAAVLSVPLVAHACIAKNWMEAK